MASSIVVHVRPVDSSIDEQLFNFLDELCVDENLAEFIKNSTGIEVECSLFEFDEASNT